MRISPYWTLYLTIANSNRHHIMDHIQAQIEKWRALILFVLAAGFLLADVQAQSWQAGLPFIKNYRAEEYKGGLQNFNIKQGKHGIIYVANNYGLLEYDGTQWQSYGVKSGTKVRSLALDGRGRIYVGCQGDFGYFFPDAKGQLTYTSLADSLDQRYRNFEETWNVYVDQEKVYFCTFSNLFVYNGQSMEVVEPSLPLDHSYLVNRQLFVNQRGIGLTKLEHNALQVIEGGKFFSNLSVSSIHYMTNDQYLLSTYKDGIFLLTNGTVAPWNESNQGLFKEANVNCMLRLKNGQFAIGTQNQGLYVLGQNGQVQMQLTRENGLENRTVLNLYEDDLQQLWVGQNNAIAYVALGSPFSFIKEENGLPGIGYAAYLDGDKFYLGTNTGLYVKGKEGGKYEAIENSLGQIYSIGHYATDVLIGHQLGAMRVEGKKAIPISPEPGSWVFLPLRGHPEILLEGTFTGLQLYTHHDNHWQWKKKLSGFAESSRVMAEDVEGKIWVTHGYKGAFRMTLNDLRDSILNVSFYGSEKGFPTNRLINVFQLRNELLFTSESGTFKYDPASDTFVPDGLFSNLLGQGSQLWFAREDALGNIYFVGRDHLGVLKKNTIGDYVLYEKEFNQIRKYLNDDLHNIDILRNNEVIYAAKNGFIHVDPTMAFKQKSIFNTIIRKVTTSNNGDSVLFSGYYSIRDSVVEYQGQDHRPTLPYESNSINFTFSAPSYESNDDGLTFQHYLENFETDWSAWSPKTLKEYTNLRENDYVFHVRAKNVSGEISQEGAYGFTVLAPWYRSRFAYVSYFLSALSVLILSYKIASRKYKRERMVMIQKQKIELTNKNNQIEELSIQSKEEIARLKNEKLEAEINHTKNELATATMHLLNKNEFITGIKTHLTQLVKKSTQDELNKELLKIAKEIETNISDDSDWEHFQFHFDRVHGDFTTRLKGSFTSLSPQETKLCAYLRMNLSSKEIAQLLNISVRGVEIGRYRLRKKLQLGREQNLQEFILNF